MDSETMPWPLVTAFGLFFLYGLWPALKPDHFRRLGLMYARPRSLAETLAPPAGWIRIFGILWLIISGFIFAVGLWSRLSK